MQQKLFMSKTTRQPHERPFINSHVGTQQTLDTRRANASPKPRQQILKAYSTKIKSPLYQHFVFNRDGLALHSVGGLHRVHVRRSRFNGGLCSRRCSPTVIKPPPAAHPPPIASRPSWGPTLGGPSLKGRQVDAHAFEPNTHAALQKGLKLFGSSMVSSRDLVRVWMLWFFIWIHIGWPSFFYRS